MDVPPNYSATGRDQSDYYLITSTILNDETYHHILALNDRPDHFAALVEIIEERL